METSLDSVGGLTPGKAPLYSVESSLVCIIITAERDKRHKNLRYRPSFARLWRVS